MKTSWDYDTGVIYDEDGAEAAYRPDGMSEEAWDWVAGRIVQAMDSLIKAEGREG